MNKEDSPLISVLIPAFNCEKYIREALESVFAQTYQNFEVIAVDDGSTDQTAQIISSFPAVHYYYQEHRGVAAARNLALENAEGKWIAFLDSDDRWDHNKLQLQMDYLTKHPDCCIIFSGVENFCDIPLDRRTARQQELLEAKMYQILPSALIDSTLFKKIGLFNTECAYGEDTEWLIIAGLMGIDTSEQLPGILYQRRIHEDNISAAHKSICSKDILAMKARIIRKNIYQK